MSKKGISRRTLFGSTALMAGANLLIPSAAAQVVPNSCAPLPTKWDFEADVVVIGAGACGMAAAIRAADFGADVLVVDTNYDIGGHAILSAGSIALGGGTALQKKYGIQDDPETYFQDLTDWSVTEVDGMPDYRFADRAVQHALAYNGPAVYDFLAANGLPFEDEAPDNFQANHASGVTALRSHHVKWKNGVGGPSPTGTNGTSVMRPLDESARKRKNIRFLFNYHMDRIFREQPLEGRVLGIEAHYTPTILPGQTKPLVSWKTDGNIDFHEPSVTVKARKGIVIATGDNTGNVEFRRMFDPRLTSEFQLGGGEWSPQDGSGELAAMAIGAALWGCCNQAMNRNGALRRGAFVGSRTSYVAWKPQSPIWERLKQQDSLSAIGRTALLSIRPASVSMMKPSQLIRTALALGSSINPADMCTETGATLRRSSRSLGTTSMRLVPSMKVLRDRIGKQVRSGRSLIVQLLSVSSGKSTKTQVKKATSLRLIRSTNFRKN